MTTSAVALCALAGAAATLPAAAHAADADRSVHGGRYSAEIRRTEYGIPHVLAHDYAGLGYGYGYAFAQDDICELADQVATVRGERARWFGPASPDDPTGTDNLDSDAYHQALNESGTVQHLLDRPAPLGPTAELRQVVDGYVAGYNRYLRETGVDRLPDKQCAGKPWVTPITAQDMWNLEYEVNGLMGSAGLAGLIGGATAPGASTPDGPTAPDRSAGRADALARLTDTEHGSNGWAIGRDASRGHDGLLLANPHLDWTGSSRFYQLQLTIPGVLDVSGASLYGTPLVEIGHTQSLAWTHTTAYGEHAEVYRLDLVPGDPTRYLVDGRAEAMGQRQVRVAVRGADGSTGTVTRTVYTSRYGPVLGPGWTTAHAYTVRDANAENLRSMNEWLALDRAQDLDQLRAADTAYQGIPWTHVIATDATGTTYFADASRVPVLTADQRVRCAVPRAGDLPPALDGSTTACDWGSDPDALVPGEHGPAEQPKLTRTDYVANSNNGPYLTNPAAPLTGLAPGYDAGTVLDPRPQLGLRMIAQRLDGTDGQGAPGFDLPTLQATMGNDRNQVAELGRDDVVALCRTTPGVTATDGSTVDLHAACDALAGWDARYATDSRGAALWQAFFWNLMRSGPRTWWKVAYDPAQPLTTPRGFDPADPRVGRALADAVEQLTAAKLPVDVPLGATQQWDGVPLPGCDGHLGCFNVVRAGADSGRAGAAGTSTAANAADGSSFVMATELTARGPQTRTLLTYGESVNPDSPHYTDQTALFSRGQWVTERYTEAEIRSAPQLQVTVLR
ncbi:penicillin acylase family protein [Kitasatospora sp. NPDC058965]|uniref:penicillin acylase family protein n=1 Tax=Kitasatospora sp. NPDC058965 TaxID=3346682 RepID=UPI0036A9BA02